MFKFLAEIIFKEKNNYRKINRTLDEILEGIGNDNN